MNKYYIFAVAVLLFLGACGSDASNSQDDLDVSDASDSGADSGGLEDTPEVEEEVYDGPRRCNGHAELCDRTLQEIALAGAHNAMSSKEDGFAGPNQNYGLQRQLDDGIRAFLLDTHRQGDKIRFCHSKCAFGATDATEQLGILRDFLDSNPDEFIVIIFEDAVSVEDTQTILEASRLDELAWQAPPDPRQWPTLGELLENGHQLLVTLESGRSGSVISHAAWELYFDTPYTFEEVSDFSCRLNRGSTSNPLFLVNHWLGRPLPMPSLADEANNLEVLWERVQECQAEHGQLPNIVAVDFYDQGALLEVVDRLNGF